MKYYFVYVLLLISITLSCDPSGNLFLTNGYEHDVIVHAVYNHNNTDIGRRYEFFPGKTFAAAARHIEYSNITAIRIETLEGEIIAEYPLEYIEQLRNVYIKKKKRNQQEAWIFTEKGLFFSTLEIDRRFNFDSEKISEYYRSDEAVLDLQMMLDQFAP